MLSNNNINNKLLTPYKEEEEEDYSNCDLICISIGKCCPSIILILFGSVMGVVLVFLGIMYI